jgi:2-dehydropantoate 2-reductase
MRFLILGAGALGGLFGAKLLKGGADVTFLVRPQRAAQLRRDGLIVKSLDGEIRSQVNVVQQEQISAPFDVVLLCCKGFDLEVAIDAVAPAIGEQSVILPVLNGVRHLDVLKERFGAQRVLGGVTAINAGLLPDGTIQQTPGTRVTMNLIGELDGHASSRVNSIKTALIAGGIQADVVNDIVARMWIKFFGWACIATISTLTRASLGFAAQTAGGPAFASAVMDECTKIFEAEGYGPPPEMVRLVRGILAQTNTDSRVSMLIDMDERRPIEADHTFGDLVARAAKRGIAVPILTAVLCNLQVYEINRTLRGA